MVYLYGIAIDCVEPGHVADFWAQALDYQQQQWSQEEIDAALEAHPEWRDRAVVEDLRARHPRLYLQRVPEAKQGQNRIRFEIGTPARLDEEAARLIELGATAVDGTTFSDPDGNEFHVVAEDGPRRFTALVVEALEPARQAAFWRATLRFDGVGASCVPPADWLRVDAGNLVAHGVHLGRPFPGGAEPGDGPVHTLAPGLRFVPVARPKAKKNRIHLDLVCELDTIDEERESAVERGAAWEDPASGHRGMFDPEGNEFCLHDPRLDT